MTNLNVSEGYKCIGADAETLEQNRYFVDNPAPKRSRRSHQLQNPAHVQKTYGYQEINAATVRMFGLRETVLLTLITFPAWRWKVEA